MNLTAEQRKNLTEILAADAGRPALEFEDLIGPKFERTNEVQLFASEPAIEAPDPVQKLLRDEFVKDAAGTMPIEPWGGGPMIKAKHDEIVTDADGFRWRNHYDENGQLIAAMPVYED